MPQKSKHNFLPLNKRPETGVLPAGKYLVSAGRPELVELDDIFLAEINFDIIYNCTTQRLQSGEAGCQNEISSAEYKKLKKAKPKGPSIRYFLIDVEDGGQVTKIHHPELEN